MKGYILGAGAQGRITAEIWRAVDPNIDLVFFDDDPGLHGQQVAGIPVAGAVRLFIDGGWDDGMAMIGIGNNLTRLDLAEAGAKRRVAWAVLVHPTATVMPSVELGEGSIVLAHGLVNTSTVVGKHVLINSGAIVEHDSIVADGAMLGPGSCTGGRVSIGRAAFISTGVTIAPRVRIGEGTIVGAGAVVVKDLPDRVLAYGVPARVKRKLEGPEEFRRVL